MRHRAVRRRGLGRKLSRAVATKLAGAGLLAISILNAPTIYAQVQGSAASRPAFDVASVKDHDGPHQGPRDIRWSYGPQGINFRTALAAAIAEAYNVPGGRIVLPRSLKNELLYGLFGEGYDIVANTDHPVSKAQLRLMLQSLLADRFKLTLHRETKTISAHRLVVAEGGPKLEEAQGEGDLVMSASAEGFVFRNAEMLRLTGVLSSYLDRTVVDETALKGLYNFALKMPEDWRQSPPAKSEGPSPDSPTAGRFAEVVKPLGLKLIPGTAPVEYLMIDHVERPSEN
jgi:bla regulator protein BlaR1